MVDELKEYIEKEELCRFGMCLEWEHQSIFEYNADEEFETASCIKVFILVALYYQVYTGKCKITDLIEYRKEMRTTGSGIIKSMEPGLSMSLKNYAILMIIVSDNTATNMLIDQIGGVDEVNKIISLLGFEHTRLLNRIDFEKSLRVGVTTPREYAKIFSMLYDEQVWRADLSREMYSILRRQQNNMVFCKHLPDEDVLNKGTGDSPIISIASKSGSLSLSMLDKENVCNDGGVVNTTRGVYIATFFASGFESPNIDEDNEVVEFMSRIHEKIYTHFMKYGKFKK